MIIRTYAYHFSKCCISKSSQLYRKKQLLYAKKLFAFLGFRLVFLWFIALPVLLAAPRPAQAGLLSFFENLWGGSKTESVRGEFIPSASASGVEALPVLDAPTNLNPAAGKDVPPMNFVENSALVASVGPLGSIANVDEVHPDAISLYTVRDGDTLSSIARTFGVSTNTILWANDLKSSSRIRPGDVLVILPVSGVKYTVKKGDTLKSIAQRFKADADEILAFNGLDPVEKLNLGLELIIPDGEVSTSPTSARGARPATLRGAGLPAIIGYYLRPTTGSLTQGLHGYNGVDLGGTCGTPIYASASGDIIIARNSGWNGGYGEYVVISHSNGTQTLYGHASQVLVASGQYVDQGQMIALIGSTGRSTGCHLHFEVRGARNPFQ